MKYQDLINEISEMNIDDKINAINELRQAIHEVSPFRNEPVDFVKWVKGSNVHANDYNPNSVAPPEMELLRVSINADGYTQPIVSMADNDNTFEVIDGFHRNRCGKEYAEINTRVHGYLPLVQIRSTQEDKTDRMASTIRHNRARGKHRVESMSEIVIELKKRNWTDAKIAKNLGMDEDEILRLCQISGLQEVFSSDSFSQSWTASLTNEELLACLDESDVEQDEDQTDRIFHEWQDWECFPAGFYKDKPPQGMSVEECEEAYASFLSNTALFEDSLYKVITRWKNSSEHYLTNEKMNRIAWLGQASMCLHTGIPSRFCGGYNLLSDEQKNIADRTAHKYLNIWLKNNNRDELTFEQAQSKSKADLY